MWINPTNFLEISFFKNHPFFENREDFCIIYMKNKNENYDNFTVIALQEAECCSLGKKLLRV
jgi:hypothetical protein